MSKFFKQVIPVMVFDGTNQRILFERTADGVGVAKLDEEKDVAAITALDIEADARRSGIVRISEEIFEAEKKKTSSRPSQRRLEALGQLRVFQQPQPFKRKPAVAASVAVAGKVEAEKPQIAPTMESFIKRTRKLSELAIKPSDFTEK
jgi:hypothetical protein